ncbi:MAG: hypothetical protein AABY15_05150 [Nanoarchaeota archaeon]
MANVKSLKPFKEGYDERRNLEGRGEGNLNKETIFLMAYTEVAEALKLGKEPDRIKVELVKKGIREGLLGKYPFWEAIMKALGLLDESESEKPKPELHLHFHEDKILQLVQKVEEDIKKELEK